MSTSLARAPERENASGSLPVLVVLYVIAFALPVVFEIGSLALTPLRLMLLIVIIPLVTNLFRGLYGGVSLIDVLFFLHVLWGTVALAINNPNQVVTFMGSNSIEFIGGYVVARASIRNADDFRNLCQLLIWLIVVSFPFAVYETLSGNPIILRLIESAPGISSITIANSGARFGFHRVQVFLAHPIHYGLFASLMFPILVIGFRTTLPTLARYTLALIVLACTLMSLSSGAVLAAILQSGLIIWAWVFRKVESRWIIFLALCIISYVTIDLLSNRTPLQVFMSYATFNPHNAYFRMIIFEWGMKNVWDNPVFGIGLNDWERPIYMRSGSMDNFWLVNVVRYGFPGFLFLAIGFTYAFWRIGRVNLKHNPSLQQLRQGWTIAMLSLAFSMTTVHVWGNLYSFVFFFVGAGVWMINAEENSKVCPPPSSPAGQVPRVRPYNTGKLGVRSPGGVQIPYTRFPK